MSHTDKSGKIYILRNSSLRKDVVKIGLTKRESERRATELSSATGVPEKFEVLYEESVANCEKAEKKIHELLDKYRVSSNKEFFALPLKTAVRAVFTICSEINKNELTRAAILVDSGLITEDRMKMLKDILLRHNGSDLETRMHIIVTRDGKRKSETIISMPKEMRVDFTEELRNELLSLECVSDVIFE